MSSNKEITNTTTDYQSLYLYVVEHIDSKGNYDASPLPDNLMREYTYGTEDAAMFRSKTEDVDMEQAKDIYLLLKAWLKNPTQKTKNNLYEKVYTTPIITAICMRKFTPRPSSRYFLPWPASFAAKSSATTCCTWPRNGSTPPRTGKRSSSPT